MKYYYDIHIHTALSPCADDDMTPNNITGMAALNGLDIIAVTDHNSACNARAVMKAAEQHKLLVIPGMELTTSEEIHVVCLFYRLSDAERFSEFVSGKRMRVPLKASVFGNQYIMDENDEITGSEKDLLYMPADISINDVCRLVKDYGGVAVPAHIDRESAGVYSVLGSFPDWDFGTVEIAGNEKRFMSVRPELANYRVVKNSDAHALENINERINFIELEEKTAKCFLDTIAQKFF